MSYRFVSFVLGAILGGVVVFFVVGGSHRDRTGGAATFGSGSDLELRLRSVEAQMAHLSEQLAGATGPVLRGSPPPQLVPEDGGGVAAEPTGMERVAMAIAALSPEDYREFFPPATENRAAWTSLGAVQRKLRSEDVHAWVAWVSEHAAKKLELQLMGLAAPVDGQWLQDEFYTYFESQIDPFLRSRSTWEDQSLPVSERTAAYQAWLREMYAAAEARNSRIERYLDENHPGWRDKRVIFPS